MVSWASGCGVFPSSGVITLVVQREFNVWQKSWNSLLPNALAVIAKIPGFGTKFMSYVGVKWIHLDHFVTSWPTYSQVCQQVFMNSQQTLPMFTSEAVLPHPLVPLAVWYFLNCLATVWDFQWTLSFLSVIKKMSSWGFFLLLHRAFWHM